MRASRLGGELFSLTPANLSCYTYGMRQDAPHSPDSSEIGRRLLPRKTNFDGTNPPMVADPSQTTTYGMNCPFLLDSIGQNRLVNLNQCRIHDHSPVRLNPAAGIHIFSRASLDHTHRRKLWDSEK
jgi:hypothetical protein